MSAYSTLRVTRSKAIECMLNRLVGGVVTDKDLEHFMDRVLEPRLYNAIIVPDGTENDDAVVWLNP